MADAFEQQARALCLGTPICDLGSSEAIKVVAIGLRETWRMARMSRDDEVAALMDKVDNFERSTLAGWRRAVEAEEKVATTIDDAMRTARNRDMWKGQSERQAARIAEMRAALEPFARNEVWGHLDDLAPVTKANEVGVKLRAGDLRRARAILSDHHPVGCDNVNGLVERLRERASAARSESTGTALGDALHFEEAADTIECQRGDAARWHLANLVDQDLPLAGRKIVALYHDGSGAVMLWAHDDGLIDAEGDEREFSWLQEKFAWWAYIPDSVKFWCETRPDDPMTLKLLGTLTDDELARTAGI